MVRTGCLSSDRGVPCELYGRGADKGGSSYNPATEAEKFFRVSISRLTWFHSVGRIHAKQKPPDIRVVFVLSI